MKNSKWTPWLVVLAVLVVIAMFMVNAYNSMVNTQETATTALADVQATCQRRADLIPNLAKTVQAYAKHEKTTLTEVINARAAATQIKLDADNLTPEKIRQYESAQGQLAQALGRLMVVAERYPDLKANQNFHSLQLQLEGTENRINEARQKYTEAEQDYNQTIRRFPNVLVAGMFGFDKMVKFEAAAGSDKAPVLNFD